MCEFDKSIEVRSIKFPAYSRILFVVGSFPDVKNFFERLVATSSIFIGLKCGPILLKDF